MKSLIKRTIEQAVRIDWLWKLLSATIVPFSRYAEAARRREESREILALQCKTIVSDLIVMNGVFAGMKYPQMVSIGSELFPKLLGSYEKELEPLFELICNNDYTEIVDIGCAEGYYAVGLAMRIRTATVFAFDTNRDAIRLCRSMADVNDVSERVITGLYCDADTLTSLPLSRRALIISDCEGFEKELFTIANVPFFARHELLIEVHDFIDIEISSYLRELFMPTHSIEVYQSIDDIKKAQEYRYKELRGLSLKQRKQVLGECRPAIMEWFYLKPRSGHVSVSQATSSSVSCVSGRP